MLAQRALQTPGRSSRLSSCAVVVSSPDEFAHAVHTYRFNGLRLDSAKVARARASLAEAGLFMLGEPHGVYETPSVVYALVAEIEARAVAFEWSHEEMDEPVQRFVQSGSFDFEHLWTLPASAEFFCGDGRITAGHFALLRRLREENRLDQVIVFDRLDPEPPPNDPFLRDHEMAERLLREWDRRLPLLVVTGGFHAQRHVSEGETMAMHLARRRPELLSAMLDYTTGQCWSRGTLHDVSGPMPAAPITLSLPEATPAAVPGPFTS